MVLAYLLVAHAAYALTPQQRQEIAQSVGTIVVPVGNTPRVGSCIVVSEQGFVATSWQLVQGASAANVTFPSGSRHEVAGFVAAREGKDLVILALRNPNNAPPPLKLATREIEPGGPVEFIGSAAGQPFDFSQGKLVRYLSGRQFLAGLEKLGPDTQRFDADTCLMRSDILQPPQGLGAAVLNEQAELAGMVTYVRPWGERIHTSVHAAHLGELVRELEKPKALPLAGLKKFGDREPQAPPEEVVSTPATNLLFLARGDVDEQLAAWRTRQAASEQETQAIKTAAKEQQANVERIKLVLVNNDARQRAIRAKLNAMMPEETYKDEEKVTKFNSKTGKNETSTKKVTKKRFSARQKAERSRLGGELADLDGAAAAERLSGLRSQSWIEQCQIDEAAAQREAARLWIDLFHLADPWGMRDGQSQRALAASLKEALGEDADSAVLRIARGIVQHNLQEFEAARDDFQQAARLDKQLAGVALACEARTLLKQDEESEGKRLLSQAVRSGARDPMVAVVQALIELDAGRFTGVERNLLNALERGGDPAEINRLAALLHSAGPDGAPHSAKKALEHARRACLVTAWQDSEALLALAAAHAEDGKFDEACQVADKAIALAKGEVLERAKAWRETFANKQRLRLAWGG